MREMYMKYDVVVGFKLTGIRMGKGQVSALNYVSVNKNDEGVSVRMTMTVSEFEEYQERLVKANEVSEEEVMSISTNECEFGRYDVMVGYTLKSIMKGKGKISGLKFVANDDKTDKLVITGKDLEAFEHYVKDLAIN